MRSASRRPDFHAVVEVWLEDGWHLVDATRLAPTEGLVRIAVGRDATDISFMTIFGSALLQRQTGERRAGGMKKYRSPAQAGGQYRAALAAGPRPAPGNRRADASRTLFGLIPAALAAACSPLTAFNALVPKDAGVVRVAHGIAYGSDPRQRLDVYGPRRHGPAPLPVIVFFYGGSWLRASAAAMPSSAARSRRAASSR